MLDLYRHEPYAKLYFVLVVLMALTLFALAIQTLPLYGTEGNYGAIAKCLLETGDWLTMRIGPSCEVAFFKGPLFYWALAGSVKIAGVNEVALRLPSLLGSVAIVALTYHLILLLTRDAVRAFVGGLVVLTTHQVAFLHREAMPEPVMIAFMVAGMVAYVLAGQKPGYLFAVGFLSFFPMLFKPVIPGFLLAIVVVHALLNRRADLLRSRYLYYGIAAGALPFMLWNLHQYAGYGAAFLWEFWGIDILGTGSTVAGIDRPGERLLGYVSTFVPKYHEHAFHSEGVWWFYPYWLALLYHPWLALLPAGVLGVFRAPAAERSGGYFALLWIVLIILFLSAVQQQGPSYLLPVYPALAVVIAGFVSLSGAQDVGRRDNWSLWLLGGLVVVKLGQLGYVSLTPGAILPAGWRFELALTAMSALVLGGWLGRRRWGTRSVVAACTGSWLILTGVYFSLVLYPQADMTLVKLRSYVRSQARPVVLYAAADWLTPRDLNPLWWYFDDLEVCRRPECVTRRSSQLPVVLATSEDHELQSLRTPAADLRFLSKIPLKLQLDANKEVVGSHDLYVLEFARKPSN